MLLTPYPPGIPLLIPGERFNATIVQLPAVRARLQRSSFPGFDTDIHGLVEEQRRRQAALLRRLRAARSSEREPPGEGPHALAWGSTGNCESDAGGRHST